ncbi:MAG: amidophosphoribosyltransferase [Sphaerochaetaceae bacterium]
MSGIVGIIGDSPAATQLYDSLIQLQHRGQDGAGIITCNERLHFKTGNGYVRDIFQQRHMQRLEGVMGIAHNKYPNSSEKIDPYAIQPFWTSVPYGIAFAHSGGLVNKEELASLIVTKRRRYLNTASDGEVLMQLFSSELENRLVEKSEGDFFELIKESVASIFELARGSYSVLALIKGKGLIAFRDLHGIKPLVMGKRVNSKGKEEFIIASEDVMFYMLGYTFVRDIEPGEVVYIDLEGKVASKRLAIKEFNPCIFEYVYFSRPDGMQNSVSVYRSRLRMGQNLGKRWKALYNDLRPDVIIPAPATANTMALAMAKELGTNYSDGLYKNPFIGRTFIMSDQLQRSQGVRYKLVPQQLEIRQKVVMIVDDSIVRGTTSKEIVTMVRNFGAKEVYFVSACPPVIQSCYYGIDIPTKDDLIAANKDEAQIREYLGVEKLMFQTVEDLIEAVTRKGEHKIDIPCHACLGGPYCGGVIA